MGRDTDKGAEADFDKVITDLAKAPGAPSATLMKLQYEEFRIACTTGSHNLHSDTRGTCSCVQHFVILLCIC